jgi:hypothetical protein
VTPDDAKRALQIYGPDVATLQGKTVKKQNSGIPNYQAVQIPAPIITSVVKEKRCGQIKGRTVADGRPQRQLYTKEESSSPTISTDALMLSLLIDATEHKDMATIGVAGAYLHAKMEDFILLKMEG